MTNKIISVDQMWSKMGGDFTLTDNFRTVKSGLQSAYQVFTTPDADINDVLQAPGIPAAGSVYSEDFPFVFADSAKPERISPVYWVVTINYNGEISLSGDPQNQQNPNAKSPMYTPALIDWDDVETELEVDEDALGQPIATANWEPIEGVKRRFADQTVTIRKNMLSFNPYIQARYRNSVNSDNFLGWPPGTAKMMKLSASSVFSSEQGGGGYWEVTAVVQFRYPYRTVPEKAWWARVRHQGFYKRVVVGDKTQVVRATKGGEPTNKPVLLDVLGYQIPDVEPPQSVNAYWMEFKLYDSLPYNALGLLP